MRHQEYRTRRMSKRTDAKLAGGSGWIAVTPRHEHRRDSQPRGRVLTSPDLSKSMGTLSVEPVVRRHEEAGLRPPVDPAKDDKNVRDARENARLAELPRGIEQPALWKLEREQPARVPTLVDRLA